MSERKEQCKEISNCFTNTKEFPISRVRDIANECGINIYRNRKELCDAISKKMSEKNMDLKTFLNKLPKDLRNLVLEKVDKPLTIHKNFKKEFISRLNFRDIHGIHVVDGRPTILKWNGYLKRILKDIRSESGSGKTHDLVFTIQSSTELYDKPSWKNYNFKNIIKDYKVILMAFGIKGNFKIRYSSLYDNKELRKLKNTLLKNNPKRKFSNFPDLGSVEIIKPPIPTLLYDLVLENVKFLNCTETKDSILMTNRDMDNPMRLGLYQNMYINMVQLHGENKKILICNNV
jgi:hypothetical protein